MAEPLEIRDFTGGPTDEPVGAALNQYQRADNILLNREGNPISRPGSLLYDSSHPQLPSGSQRVSSIINLNRDTDLFATSGPNLYRYSAGWTAITGSAGAALLGATSASHPMSAEWRKQLFLVTDEQTPPARVYYDDTAAGYVARTAGLPFMAEPENFVAATALASLIALANDLRTQLLTHMADVVQHTVADTTSAALLTAPAATTFNTLVTLAAQLQKAYGSHWADTSRPGVTVHKFPSQVNTLQTVDTARLINLTAPTTYVDLTQVLNELKIKYSIHYGDVDVHDSHSDGPVITAAFVSGVTVGANAPVDLTSMYAFANTLKTKINAHKAKNAGAGQPHLAYPGYYNITAADATTYDTLRSLVLQLRISLAEHVNGPSEAAAMHSGTSADIIADLPTDPVYASAAYPFPDLWGGAPSGAYDLQLDYLNNILTKYIHHQSLTVPHQANAAYVNVDTLPGIQMSLATYLYATHHLYSFTSYGVTYAIAGPVFEFQAENVLAIEQQPITVQNIPVLANSGSLNYDTSNVIIKIARTTAGGSQLYYCGQVTNGTTSFVDRMADEDLQNQAQIYTSGGIIQSDPPPYAKYMHIVGSIAYYGNITEQGVSYPNRVRQSLPNTIDGCPGSFFADLPQECVGISSARGIPVAWTKSRAFRLEGSFDLLGRGAMIPVAIQDSVGLLASSSPIQTDEGVIFAGIDGWYFTDGYKVTRISKHWPTTYATMTTATRAPLIRGDVDSKNQRVYWSVSQGGSECDSALVLDLNFPLTENSLFTTWSNDTHFAPTAWCYFAGQMLRGDSRGYIFKHDPTYLTDPNVNTGITPSTWLKKTIRYDWRSVAYDFGTLKFRKWVTKLKLKARNKGNLSLQVNSINDDGRVISALTPIRFRGITPVVDVNSTVAPGEPALPALPLIDEKRRFPAGSLRCSNKQLHLTNAKVGITNSDSLGLTSVNGTTKVVTLAAGSFPADLSDHVIAFETDNFVAEWTIVSQSGGTVTVTDPGGTLTNLTSKKWVIRGYPKDEQLQLLSLSLEYTVLGEEQKSAAGESGENV